MAWSLFAAKHAQGSSSCGIRDCRSLRNRQNALQTPGPEDPIKKLLDLCERLVSWEYFQRGRPVLGPEASEWYESYRQYYQGIAPGR